VSWFNIIKNISNDPLQQVGEELLKYAEDVYNFWNAIARTRIDEEADRKEMANMPTQANYDSTPSADADDPDVGDLVIDADARVQDIYSIVHTDDYEAKPAALMFELVKWEWERVVQGQIDVIPEEWLEGTSRTRPELPDIEEMKRKVRMFIEDPEDSWGDAPR